MPCICATGCGSSRLADLLPSLRAVWVGLSAGSMVMTPSIGEDFVRWKPPAGSDRTLGLVDFSIFPHLDNENLPTNCMATQKNGPPACRSRHT
jgi:dipeptidase E